LVAAAVVASGCGGKSKAQTAPPLSVDVTKATQQDIATYMNLDGQVAPFLDATLASTQSGTLAGVYVNQGDVVTKGQLLAKIDDSQLRAQLAANEATVAQSQSKVQGSMIQAPISSQTYNTTLSQAEARLSSDQAALRNAALVNKSDQTLMAQGYVSQTAAEQARATYVAAQQQIATDESAIAAAKAGMGQTAVDQATIAQNRATLQQAEANVQLLQTQIAQSSIVAPFDGVVTQRLLDPGAYAGPNQAVVRVSQLNPVYVNANVPDENLQYTRNGTPVSFTTPSIPGRTFHGTIYSVNAVPTTGTLSYRAQIRQPNPDNQLRGGMLVTVTIRKELHKNAIVVPRAAVFTSDQGSNVYTVEGDKAKSIPVQIGLQTDTLTEVRGAGLTPGTVVITTRPDALQDGSLVAVGTAPPAKAQP